MAKDWSKMFAPTLFEAIDELDATDPRNTTFTPKTFSDMFALASYRGAEPAAAPATRAAPIASDLRNSLYSGRRGAVDQVPKANMK